MKVAHVLENFYPDSQGGTENYVRGISKAMSNLGYEVHVVAPRVEGHDDCYILDGIKVWRYGILKNVGNKQYKGLEAPDGLGDFVEIVKKINPDIVHFHTFNRAVNTYHLRSVAECGFRTVFTPHQAGIVCSAGTMLENGNKRCEGIVSRKKCVKCVALHSGTIYSSASFQNIISSLLPNSSFFRRVLPGRLYLKRQRMDELYEIGKYADVTIAISEWVEELLIKNGVPRVTLVKQGINTGFTKFGGNDATRQLKLVFVGRVYPIKNLELLCEAVESIDTADIELTIICVKGNDDYYINTKKKVNSIKNTRWIEDATLSQINEIVGKSDFLVLPSKSEMSPLVVLEAFASGTPVIGSDIPPISDLVIDGVNGKLFVEGNANSLRELLIWLMHNPKEKTRLRLGVKAPRTFVEVAEELSHIYNEIKQEGKKR